MANQNPRSGSTGTGGGGDSGSSGGGGGGDGSGWPAGCERRIGYRLNSGPAGGGGQ